jgi:hypothetical protein
MAAKPLRKIACRENGPVVKCNADAYEKCNALIRALTRAEIMGLLSLMRDYDQLGRTMSKLECYLEICASMRREVVGYMRDQCSRDGDPMNGIPPSLLAGDGSEGGAA